MNITFDSKNKLFNISTLSSSYIMGIMHGDLLVHLYYGKKINYPEYILNSLPYRVSGDFAAIDADGASTETVTLEYPSNSAADLSSPALRIIHADGSDITVLKYDGHRIFHDKKPLPSLPSSYSDSECMSLEINLVDKTANVRVILSYTVFENSDIISKSVRIINESDEIKKLESALSAVSYLYDKDYSFVHLEGGYGRERNIQSSPIINGTVSIDSSRMASGHKHSPFMALAKNDTTETFGDVYGFLLVYSGNFICEAKCDHFDVTRALIGINPYEFIWHLEPNEDFYTPEVLCVYSDSGFEKMSQEYHRFIRNNICRGKYKNAERPILINNWEATYFKFTEDKIVKIAKKASSVGIELFVLDDGWFGERNSDNGALGDWYVNRKKLPGGIEGLSGKINKLGMKFGLWFEPEMVSVNSDLYRSHPDWCIYVKGRQRTESRHQLILDLTREEVRDYIVKSVSEILSSADISYVKWDMNRNVSEFSSVSLPPERQQEFPHRYILGLYDIMGRITSAFPEILFEGCSGGGGRYDCGMLYYMPQYWASDNSDAIERLYIQHGTSLVFPMSTMGAHISAVPNHQTGRTVSLSARGNVALCGQLGFELDITKLSENELTECKHIIEKYKRIRNITHYGNMYRISSPFDSNTTVWQFVSDDLNESYVIFCTSLVRFKPPLFNIKLRGLDLKSIYIDENTNKEYSGDYLMNVGLYFDFNRDFSSGDMILKKIK